MSPHHRASGSRRESLAFLRHNPILHTVDGMHTRGMPPFEGARLPVPYASLAPPPSPSPVKGEGIKEGESLPEIASAPRCDPLIHITVVIEIKCDDFVQNSASILYKRFAFLRLFFNSI